jgi:hypothetical protein
LITELSAAEETALEDASTRMEIDSAATSASDNFIDLTMKETITLDHSNEDGKVSATRTALKGRKETEGPPGRRVGGQRPARQCK